jgi:acyl-[acyl carrier protein]--UDP-N-acetylglucosamine O-acyltransferase
MVPGQFYGGWNMSEQDIARLQEQIKTIFSDVDELKEDVKEIKQQLANRLPLWATMLISALTGVIGWLIR